MKNAFTAELTWKNLLIFLGLVAVGVALYHGGRLVFRNLELWPRSGASVRVQVFRYIRERSGTSHFEIAGTTDSELDTNSPVAQLNALRQEMTILQTNMARVNASVRSNRTEIALLTAEIKKLNRPPVLPGSVRRKNTNSPPAKVAGKAQGTNDFLAKASRPVGSRTNLSAEMSLVAQTNQVLIAEKQKVLTAKQKELAEGQKQLEVLAQDLKPLQKNLSAKQRELTALIKGGSGYNKLIRDLNRQMQEAMSWAALYEVLGQELWLAEKLMGSTNPLARAAGLQAADQARSQALGPGENAWLAARICEGFIWPNLQHAEPNAKTSTTRDQLLTSAGLTFRQAQETNHYLKNAEMLIANSTSPVRADYTRYQLGLVFESMGAYEKALEQYRAIQYTNSLVYAAKRIPFLEDKLQQLKGRKG